MDAFISRLRHPHRNKHSHSERTRHGNIPEPTNPTTNPTTVVPRETPHAHDTNPSSQPLASSSLSSVAQKIHPNLDALAAQLHPPSPAPAPPSTTSTPPPPPLLLSQSTSTSTSSYHALTPRRRSIQRRSLSRRTHGSPAGSPHSSVRLSSRRIEQLVQGSPSPSSSPDSGYHAVTLRRGLGLSEFGVQEREGGSGSRSGSDWDHEHDQYHDQDQDDALSSPTTSTSNSLTRRQGQRDSRSTGSHSHSHSRRGSRSTPPIRPQSAFTTRLATDIVTVLSNIPPSQPPSPSEAAHTSNTHSGSDSTSNNHYESASSQNDNGGHGHGHGQTPNTFGGSTPVVVSNMGSLSYGYGHAETRPSLPRVEELEARMQMQMAEPGSRRRSASVVEGQERRTQQGRRRNTTTIVAGTAASSSDTHGSSNGNSTPYESAVSSLRSSRHSESSSNNHHQHQNYPHHQQQQVEAQNTPGPSSTHRHIGTPNTFGFPTPILPTDEPRPPVPPLRGMDVESSNRKRSKSVGSRERSRSQAGPSGGSRWSIRKKRSKSSSGEEQRQTRVSESSQSTAKPGSGSGRRSRTQSAQSTSASASGKFGLGRVGGRSSRSQSQTSLSGRRISAEWSAQQAAAAGVSWEADVAREMLKYLDKGMSSSSTGLGTSLEPSPLAQGYGLHNEPYRVREAYPDKLSYTHSGEAIYPQSRIDYPRAHAHAPATTTTSRRDEKRKAKEVEETTDAMHSGSLHSQNTVTFTDHDRVQTAAASSSSRNTGSLGRKSSPPKSALRPQVSTSTSLLQPPQLELTLPTPDGSPGRRSASEPTAPPLQSALKVPGQLSRSTTSTSKGKRKVDDVDGSPPKAEKEAHRATFATEPRAHRASANSGSSHAPSSYHRKRARLSVTESLSPSASQINAVASSSRSSSAQPPQTPTRTPSRASARAMSSRSARSHSHAPSPRQPRRSMSEMSQTSIPISALISPHAPSISQYSNTYHMRDPRRPTKPFETPWSLRFPTPGEPGSGSPVHAWMFFIGFIFFPLWWVASFWRIPMTRKMGGNDVEKAVVIDDPQVEFDAKSWRFRCRIMSVISFITYIPFIILVAIFAR